MSTSISISRLLASSAPSLGCMRQKGNLRDPPLCHSSGSKVPGQSVPFSPPFRAYQIRSRVFICTQWEEYRKVCLLGSPTQALRQLVRALQGLGPPPPPKPCDRHIRPRIIPGSCCALSWPSRSLPCLPVVFLFPSFGFSL